MGIHTTCINYNNLIQKKKKKEQMILIQVKYNHKSMKEINLMPSRQFSDISKFQKKISLKMKKIDNYGLNYNRYIVQTLVLHILSVLSENTNG